MHNVKIFPQPIPSGIRIFLCPIYYRHSRFPAYYGPKHGLAFSDLWKIANCSRAWIHYSRNISTRGGQI